MKKRNRRRTIEIDPRERNGRHQRGSRGERREDVTETMAEARERVFGIPPALSRDTLAETVFGRMALSGELAPCLDGESMKHNAQRNRALHELGVEFQRLRSPYLKAKMAPPPLGSAGNLERVRGHDGSDGTDPDYVAFCATAIRRYEAMRDAIVDHAGMVGYVAAKRIISDDEDLPKIIGDLRMALNGIKLHKERQARTERIAA